jgi:hypothetical protein
MKSHEITENGLTYVVEEYDNGTVVEYIKKRVPTPDPQPEPVTLDQVYEQNLDIMDGLATLYEMQAGGAE